MKKKSTKIKEGKSKVNVYSECLNVYMLWLHEVYEGKKVKGGFVCGL